MFNSFVLKNIKIVEIIGVIMRIISFSLVSWLGSKSPFLFVWGFNTTDAILLSWCAILKKDFAYTLAHAGMACSELPMTRAAHGLFAKAKVEGLEGSNITALARLYQPL